MNNLSIELNWTIGDGELSFGKYSTDHTIKVTDETVINAS